MGVFCIDDFHGGVYVYASYFMYIQDGMCRLDIDYLSRLSFFKS